MEYLIGVLLCSLFFYTSTEPLETVKCILSPLQESAEEAVGQMNVTNIDGASKVVVIHTKQEFETVLHFVSTLFHSNRDCSEVVGVVGDVDYKTASILHTLASRSNFTLTLVAAVAPSNLLPVTNSDLPNLLDIHPLSHYIETIVSFIDAWNWSRIGLIRDDTLYYQYATEKLHAKLAESSKTITLNCIVKKSEHHIQHILQQVKVYDTHTLILSMRKETALFLLKEAQKLDYIWPKYAWIVFCIDTDPDTFTDNDLEGVFLTQDHSRFELDKILNTLGNYSTFLSSNSDILDIPLPGNDLVKFRGGKRLFNVSVVQLMNPSESELELEIAYYDPELKQLNVIHNLSASGNIPQGSTVIVEYKDSAAVVSVVMIIFTSIFTFVTIIFAFYIYFRDEPEIRAASFSVSLAMFLGCYLMLLFMPLLMIDGQPDGWLGFNGDIICNILAVCSGISVPSVLILAALFVKMLRVYAIFMKPFSLKRKLFSNVFLFLYISLILLPTLLILIFWMALDPFKNVTTVSYEKSHLLLIERCEANYTLIWIDLLFLYTLSIIIAVAVLAFKSSEIRFKNFRDTKATNAFAFLFIFTDTLLVIYWFFIRSLGRSISIEKKLLVTLCVTHFTLPLLCQVFLFIPKVYPPIIRHLTKNTVKRKGLTK